MSECTTKVASPLLAGQEGVDDVTEEKSSLSFSSSSMGGLEPEMFVGAEVVTPEAKEDAVVRKYSLSHIGNKHWEVYIDQSKNSLDRGASATLDAFTGLAPSTVVAVHPAVLPKSKSKGPYIRCISRTGGTDAKAFEVGNVDSVDKVYRVLTHHMGVTGVNPKARDSLKWKYQGNGHLEAGEIALAIDAYDKALQSGFADQEGIILLMRSTAYLRRASSHQQELKRCVDELLQSIAETAKLEELFAKAAQSPSLTNPILKKVLGDTRNQDVKFKQTIYRHGLYQYALLHAAQDSLRATQLLSTYAKTWLRAGEILAELWKLKESVQYYEKAIELDPTLEAKLRKTIDRLHNRQQLLENARAYGWSEDTLRLALDVSG